MIEHLTSNTQAILLLTAPLLAGGGETSRDLLSLGEYKKIVQILRENQKQPADLIGPDAREVIGLCANDLDRSRLEALLGRGFLLSQAVDGWNTRAIWVISRADANYPKKLKARLKEDAPPLLYGCGDVGLLEKGGLAVVGSRHVDDEQIAYAENVGRLSAAAHRTIISGGAKGIDRAAMFGALGAGGKAAGVMADSLERAALSRDSREALMEGRLIFISPYDPAAGFNVGHAMQRNKIIYSLSDAALVVTADFEKGGTWAGAVEQLDRLRFVPVFVCNRARVGKGNSALLRRGGKPWSNPQNGAELGLIINDAATSFSVAPTADAFPLLRPENMQGNNVAPTETVLTPQAETLGPNTAQEKLPPETDPLKTVREIIQRELVKARTETEVAAILAVTKSQAKAWLTRLIGEAVLEKVVKSKPARYRTIQTVNRLF